MRMTHYEYPEPTVQKPSIRRLIEAEEEYGTVEATDGCLVEVDGICPHGHPSWLMQLGLA